MVLNNQQITEEIKKEIKKEIKINENENTTMQNVRDYPDKYTGVSWHFLC